MSDPVQPVLTASQAIDAAVAEKAMLSHRFYRAWTAGRLSRETLAEYARQYFHHVEAFPQAVSATHAHCPNRDGRRLLAENLAEEEGVEAGKSDHASLWLDFAAAMGADEASVRAVARNAETEALVATFRSLSRQSYAAGLGALYAYESQLPEVSSTKIAGLKAFYGVDDARAIRFFRVHEHADVAHAAACRALLDRLEGDDRAEAIAAGGALAAALWGFLDGVARDARID